MTGIAHYLISNINHSNYLSINDYSIKRTISYIMTLYNVRRDRKSANVFIRFSIMKWLKDNTNYSYREIGETLYKHKPLDHATVYYGICKANLFLETNDKEFIRYYSEIIELIENSRLKKW